MESQQVSTSRVAGLPHKMWVIVRKFKWEFVGLAVVLLLLLGWQAQRVTTNNNWKKATDYYRRADYQNAAKILNKMSLPKDSERLNVYAQTMLATQQLDKAATAYQKLYTVKKDPFAKLVLGNIYNQQKKYDEAAKIYQQLIDANPSYIQAYVNLATLYKLQNNNAKAISVAQKGAANNPSNATLAELVVSLTMEDKDSGDYKKALENLKKLNPKDPLLEAIKQ